MGKTRIPGFLAGCLTTVTALALGTTVLAASGQVTFSFANVSLNGEAKIAAGTTITAANGQQVPSSILYTDSAGGKTNYLPIRSISELLGVEVGYDSATKTVMLGAQQSQETASGKQWQRAVEGTSVTYQSQTASASHTTPPAWCPTDLPEGWSLSEAFCRTRRATYCYRGSTGSLTLRCAYPDGGSFGYTLQEESSIENCQQVTIQGHTADLYTEGKKVLLVWEGQDGILFWFSGTGLSPEEVVEAAKSVEPVSQRLPDYQLTWMPGGYARYERCVLGSAVQETWLGPDTSLTLLYAATPLALPEGTSTPVEVRGIEAQYWGAEEPYENDGGSLTVNGEAVEGDQAEIRGVIVSSGTIVGPTSAGANTLFWKDPETGLFFRLHGTVDKDTLLTIAQRIRA